MNRRAALRSGTADAHRRVDAAFSRFDLTSRAGYTRFLVAQAAGFLPAEAALDAAGAQLVLPDWPERRRGLLLEADLAELSVTAPEPFLPPLILSGNAPVLGAIYVLEGSRLGGALLKRSVPADFPKRFLDARQLAGSWRKLLASLDDLLTRQDDLDAAIQAANEVFARFEEGAKAQTESLAT
ncbi:MAG TPA: biliverdin-producing heme oxygenase [Allosphingosinicella sp.]|nr:biliverdin-producing heme oxygenase [Allosphingosinicella sp.]